MVQAATQGQQVWRLQRGLRLEGDMLLTPSRPRRPRVPESAELPSWWPCFARSALPCPDGR
eukprot:14878765-Alexandrium_andersonii.AAC.1